jgi:hypothetical protein
MVDFGRWLAARQHVDEIGVVQGTGGLPPNLARALPDLFVLSDLVLSDALAQPGRAPLLRDIWLPDIEVMAARDSAHDAGFYLAAKGGHNDESHNHNDIGNFVVFVDGDPVLVDAGVETYTAKTFSDRRYEIWTMQSAYHSLLPTVDGIQQEPGAIFAARNVSYAVDDVSAALTLDVAGAYPPAAKLANWRRTVTLQRGAAVTIVDVFAFVAPVHRVELALLTPCVATVDDGRIVLATRSFGEGQRAGAAVVTYDAATFRVATESVPITDERMGAVWGDHLTRIVLTVEKPPMQGEWRCEVRRA